MPRGGEAHMRAREPRGRSHRVTAGRALLALCLVGLCVVPSLAWPLLIDNTGNVTMVSKSDINILPESGGMVRLGRPLEWSFQDNDSLVRMRKPNPDGNGYGLDMRFAAGASSGTGKPGALSLYTRTTGEDYIASAEVRLEEYTGMHRKGVVTVTGHIVLDRCTKTASTDSACNATSRVITSELVSGNAKEGVDLLLQAGAGTGQSNPGRLTLQAPVRSALAVSNAGAEHVHHTFLDLWEERVGTVDKRVGQLDAEFRLGNSTNTRFKITAEGNVWANTLELYSTAKADGSYNVSSLQTAGGISALQDSHFNMSLHAKGFAMTGFLQRSDVQTQTVDYLVTPFTHVVGTIFSTIAAKTFNVLNSPKGAFFFMLPSYGADTQFSCSGGTPVNLRAGATYMVLCESATVARTLGFNTTLQSAGNLEDATGLWSMHESGGIQIRSGTTANAATTQDSVILIEAGSYGKGKLNITVGTSGITQTSKGTFYLESKTAFDIKSDLGLDIIANGADFTVNSDKSISLTASEDVLDAIRIHASAVTGGIDMDAGTNGIDMRTTGKINAYGAGQPSVYSVAADTDGDDLTISVTGTNHDSSVHISSTGVGVDAISLTASSSMGGIDIAAGNYGIDIDTTGAFTLDMAGNSSWIKMAADAAGEDLTIQQTSNLDASVHIISNGTGVDAISIQAWNTVGGIDIDAGTNGINTLTTGPNNVHSNGAYSTYKVTADAVGEDLTIQQAGVLDASVHILSSGTGVDAISIQASNAAGGIDIDAGTNGINTLTTGPNNVHSNGAYSTYKVTADAVGEDLTIQQAGVLDASVHILSSGTGVDAISIKASNAAGGIDIDAGTNGINTLTTGPNNVHSNGAYSTYKVTADAVGEDLTIQQAGVLDASVHILSSGTGVDAISIQASNAAGGIDIDAGTNGINTLTTGPNNVHSNGAYSTYKVTADAVGEDLTIQQAGVLDASVHILSSGTGVDAISIQASNAVGGIDIDAGTQGIDVLTTGTLKLVTNGGPGPAADITIDAKHSIAYLQSGYAVKDAVTIRTTNSDGGITSFAGTKGYDIDTTGDFDLDVERAATVDAHTVTLTARDDQIGAIAMIAEDANGGISMESGLSGISMMSTGSLVGEFYGATIRTNGMAPAGDISLHSQEASVYLEGGEASPSAVFLEASHPEGGVSISGGTSGAGTVTVQSGTGGIDIESKGGSEIRTLTGDNRLYSETQRVVVESGRPTYDAVYVHAGSSRGGVYMKSEGSMDLKTIGREMTLDSTENSLVLTSRKESGDAIHIKATDDLSGMTVDVNMGGFTVEGKSGDITLKSEDAVVELESTQASPAAVSIVASDAMGGITMHAGAHGGGVVEIVSGSGGVIASSVGPLVGTFYGAVVTSYGPHGDVGDVRVEATQSSVVIDGGEDAADAVRVVTSHPNGGVDVKAGYGGIDIQAMSTARLAAVHDTVSVESTKGTPDAVVIRAAHGSGGIDIDSGDGGIDMQSTSRAELRTLNGELVLNSTDSSVVATSHKAANDAVRFQALDRMGGLLFKGREGGIRMTSDGGVTELESNLGRPGAVTLVASDAEGGVALHAGAHGSGVVEIISGSGGVIASSVGPLIGTFYGAVVTSYGPEGDVGNVLIEATQSSVTVDGGEDVADAVKVVASGPNGGMQIAAGVTGSGGISIKTGTTGIDAHTTGAFSLTAGAEGGDGGVAISAGVMGAGKVDVESGNGGMNLASSGSLTGSFYGALIETFGRTDVSDVHLHAHEASVRAVAGENTADAVSLTASHRHGGMELKAGTRGITVESAGTNTIESTPTDRTGLVVIKSRGNVAKAVEIDAASTAGGGITMAANTGGFTATSTKTDATAFSFTTSATGGGVTVNANSGGVKVYSQHADAAGILLDSTNAGGAAAGGMTFTGGTAGITATSTGGGASAIGMTASAAGGGITLTGNTGGVTATSSKADATAVTLTASATGGGVTVNGNTGGVKVYSQHADAAGILLDSTNAGGAAAGGMTFTGGTAGITATSTGGGASAIGMTASAAGGGITLTGNTGGVTATSSKTDATAVTLTASATGGGVTVNGNTGGVKVYSQHADAAGILLDSTNAGGAAAGGMTFTGGTAGITATSTGGGASAIGMTASAAGGGITLTGNTGGVTATSSKTDATAVTLTASATGGGVTVNGNTGGVKVYSQHADAAGILLDSTNAGGAAAGGMTFTGGTAGITATSTGGGASAIGMTASAAGGGITLTGNTGGVTATSSKTDATAVTLTASATGGGVTVNGNTGGVKVYSQHADAAGILLDSTNAGGAAAGGMTFTGGTAGITATSTGGGASAIGMTASAAGGGITLTGNTGGVTATSSKTDATAVTLTASATGGGVTVNGNTGGVKVYSQHADAAGILLDSTNAGGAAAGGMTFTGGTAGITATSTGGGASAIGMTASAAGGGITLTGNTGGVTATSSKTDATAVTLTASATGGGVTVNGNTGGVKVYSQHADAAGILLDSTNAGGAAAGGMTFTGGTAGITATSTGGGASAIGMTASAAGGGITLTGNTGGVTATSSKTDATAVTLTASATGGGVTVNGNTGGVKVYSQHADAAGILLDSTNAGGAAAGGITFTGGTAGITATSTATGNGAITLTASAGGITGTAAANKPIALSTSGSGSVTITGGTGGIAIDDGTQTHFTASTTTVTLGGTGVTTVNVGTTGATTAVNMGISGGSGTAAMALMFKSGTANGFKIQDGTVDYVDVGNAVSNFGGASTSTTIGASGASGAIAITDNTGGVTVTSTATGNGAITLTASAGGITGTAAANKPIALSTSGSGSVTITGGTSGIAINDGTQTHFTAATTTVTLGGTGVTTVNVGTTGATTAVNMGISGGSGTAAMALMFKSGTANGFKIQDGTVDYVDVGNAVSNFGGASTSTTIGASGASGAIAITDNTGGVTVTSTATGNGAITLTASAGGITGTAAANKPIALSTSGSGSVTITGGTSGIAINDGTQTHFTAATTTVTLGGTGVTTVNVGTTGATTAVNMGISGGSGTAAMALMFKSGTANGFKIQDGTVDYVDVGNAVSNFGGASTSTTIGASGASGAIAITDNTGGVTVTSTATGNGAITLTASAGGITGTAAANKPIALSTSGSGSVTITGGTSGIAINDGTQTHFTAATTTVTLGGTGVTTVNVGTTGATTAVNMGISGGSGTAAMALMFKSGTANGFKIQDGTVDYVDVGNAVSNFGGASTSTTIGASGASGAIAITDNTGGVTVTSTATGNGAITLTASAGGITGTAAANKPIALSTSGSGSVTITGGTSGIAINDGTQTHFTAATTTVTLGGTGVTTVNVGTTGATTAVNMGISGGSGTAAMALMFKSGTANGFKIQDGTVDYVDVGNAVSNFGGASTSTTIGASGASGAIAITDNTGGVTVTSTATGNGAITLTASAGGITGTAAANKPIALSTSGSGSVTITGGTSGIAINDGTQTHFTAATTTVTLGGTGVTTVNVGTTGATTAVNMGISGGSGTAAMALMFKSGTANGFKIQDGTVDYVDVGNAVSNFGGASTSTTIGASGASGAIAITDNTGGVTVTSTKAAADAIQLTASGTGGGITMTPDSGGITMTTSAAEPAVINMGTTNSKAAVLTLFGNGATHIPSIAMYDSAGAARWICVHTDGVLYTATAKPTTACSTATGAVQYGRRRLLGEGEEAVEGDALQRDLAAARSEVAQIKSWLQGRRRSLQSEEGEGRGGVQGLGQGHGPAADPEGALLDRLEVLEGQYAAARVRVEELGARPAEPGAASAVATEGGGGEGQVGAGVTFVAVASRDPDHRVTLPPPAVGLKISIAAEGAFRLQTSDPEAVSINGGSGARAASKVPANSMVECWCASATRWMCSVPGGMLPPASK